MPTSKICLPDVNVWLALASKRHAHNEAAAEWLEGVGPEQAVFCRITQMGLLRLLTNQRCMGVDVVGQVEAWRVYQRMTRDLRVQFLTEPAGIEAVWRQLTQSSRPGAGLWTDAYVQAFATLKDLRVVSLDKGFRRFAGPEALILG